MNNRDILMKWQSECLKERKISSIGPINTLTKMSKLRISELWKLTKVLEPSKIIVWEKWLKLLKISKLHGALTCPPLSSLFFDNLENQQPHNYSSCGNQAISKALERRNRFRALQMACLQMITIWPTWQLPEKPLSQEFSLFDLMWLCMSHANPRTLVKNKFGKCLTLQLTHLRGVEMQYDIIWGQRDSDQKTLRGKTGK